MRVHLDTHTFLWWIFDPRLSRAARSVIADDGTVVVVSAVSAWEIAIKAPTGRLHLLPPDVPGFITGQLRTNGFEPLPVQLAHALHVHSLPSLHKDPFDRLLVAQAQVERLPLVTRDRQLAGYGIDTVW